MKRQAILFVDEQQEPLFYHQIMLEQAGFNINFYRSPEEAIRYVEKWNYSSDLPVFIILDINLPPDGRFLESPENASGQRTGFFLFKELCKILEDKGLDLPHVIFLTQLNDPDILKEASDLVNDGFVLDKFMTGPSALLEKIKSILEKPR